MKLQIDSVCYFPQLWTILLYLDGAITGRNERVTRWEVGHMALRIALSLQQKWLMAVLLALFSI